MPMIYFGNPSGELGIYPHNAYVTKSEGKQELSACFETMPTVKVKISQLTFKLLRGEAQAVSHLLDVDYLCSLSDYNLCRLAAFGDRERRETRKRSMGTLGLTEGMQVDLCLPAYTK
jgi:hypothetical protein